jgi:WD40 repeat protein
VAVSDGAVTECRLPALGSSVAWSPDGDRLAAGAADGRIFVCRPDAPRAAPLVLEGHNGRVVNLAFHPHEDILVSAGWDQKVRLWDLTHPSAAVRTLFSYSYQALEFSADGCSLGLGRDGTRTWVWEVLLPAVGHTVVRAGQLWGSALSPDGRLLAGMGESGLHLWDVREDGRPVPIPLGPALGNGGRRVWFAPDGRSLITGTALGVTRYALARTEGAHAPTLRPEQWWPGVGIDHWWSRDRALLAVVPEHRVVTVYEWPGWKERFTVHHAGRLEYLSFSPGNRWLAGGAWQRPNVKVWDAATGVEVIHLKTAPTARPLFSPDGRWLVIGTGAAYQFHETGTWKSGLRIAREDCGSMPATGAFSPDGETFAGWSRPGVVTLFDSRSGREQVSLPITARTGSFDTHGELQFAAGGSKLLVVADGRHIQVWNIADLRARLAAVALDWERPDLAR